MSNNDSRLKAVIVKAGDLLGKTPSAVKWHEVKRLAYKTNELIKGSERSSFQENFENVGGFNAFRDLHFPKSVSPMTPFVKKSASAARKKAVIEASDAFIQSSVAEAIESSFKSTSFKSVKPPKKATFLNRAVHLGISDIHIGSDLDPEEGLRKYGPEEEARSMATVVAEAINYKTQHREKTILNININGDIIQGKLHDVQDAAPISEQCCRCIHLLTQMIYQLSTHYPEVKVHFSSGNHDRIKTRHPDRASSAKYDSYATIIYFAVQTALKHLKNVRFNLPKTPFFVYDQFGSHTYGTHGDNNIKIPFPSATINVNSITNDINRLNSRINGPRYDVVFCGHVHAGMLLHLSNGVVLITNPPLIPTDSYAQSLNIDPDAPTGQWLWESVPGHPVGDSRFICVKEHNRKDQGMDKLITPFKGYSCRQK